MFKLMKKKMKNVYSTMLLLYPYLNDTYVCDVLSYANEAWEFHKGGAIEKTHLENKETRSNHFLDLDLKIDCQKNYVYSC